MLNKTPPPPQAGFLFLITMSRDIERIPNRQPTNERKVLQRPDPVAQAAFSDLRAAIPEAVSSNAVVLVIQARTIPERIAQERQLFENLARGTGTTLRFINPLDPKDKTPWGNPEAILDGVHGIILAGSGEVDLPDSPNPDANKRRDDYLAKTQALITESVKRGLREHKPMPVAGICLGHQVLHTTLGGRVENDPDRKEIETSVLMFTDTGAADPYIRDMLQENRRLAVQAGHHGSVVKLGEGFEVIARTPKDPHAVTRRRGILTFQPHPELADATDLQKVIELANFGREGDELYHQTGDLGPSQDAPKILIEFFKDIGGQR